MRMRGQMTGYFAICDEPGNHRHVRHENTSILIYQAPSAKIIKQAITTTLSWNRTGSPLRRHTGGIVLTNGMYRQGVCVLDS